MLFGELGGTNQVGNHRGERRGGIARIFLPAFLGGDRSLPDEIPRGPGNHDARIEPAQGNAFIMQPPRQQNGGRHFIELHTGPIGIPIYPAILWEAAIRPLNGRQPYQGAQRRSGLIRSQEGGRALHQVAGPDQVITAQIVVALCLAPRDAHRRHQGALKSLIFMGEQDAAAQPIHVTAVRGELAEIGLRLDHCALPLAHIGLAMDLERLRQRLQQLRHRALTTPPKSDGDGKGLSALRVDFASQRNVAMPGCAEFPVHLEIRRQILPTVAGPDIPN